MSVALPRPSTLPPTYPRKEGSRGVSPHAQTPPRSGVSDGQRKSTSPSSHDKPMLSLRSNASDGVAASHSSASHSAPLSVHLVREGGRHATAAPAGGHPFLFPRASSLMHSTDEDDDNESVQQPLEVQLVRDGANRVAAPAAHRKPSALSTVYMDDHTTEVPSADEDEEAALSTVLLPSTVNRRAKHRVDSLPETDSEVSMESPHRPPGLTEGTDSAHDAGNQSHSSLNTSELQSDAPPQDQNHTATDRKTQPSPEQSHTSAPRTGDRGHHAQAHSLPEHLEGQEPATPASSRHTDMVESSHRSLLPTEEASDSATAESTKHAPEQSHTSAPRNAMSEGQPASTATLADRVEGLEPVSPASSRHTDLAESSQRSLPTNEAAQLSRNTPPTDRLPIDSDTSPQCLSQCAGNLSPQSSNIPTPQHQPDRKLGEEAGTPHESRHTSAEEASLPSSRSSVKGDPASVHNLSSRNMLDGVASEPSSRHAGMDGQSELSDSSSVGGHASVRDAPERDAGSEVGSNYPSRHAEAHEPSQVAHPSAASVQSAQSAATTQSHMLSQCAGNFSAPSTQATSPQATSPQAQDKCVTPVVSCLSEHNEGDEARTMSGSRHTMSEEASIPSSRSSVKGGPASVHNLSSRNMLDGVASEPSSRHAGMDGQSELSDSSSVGGHASVRDAPERDAGSEVGSNYPSRHAEAHEPSQVAHPSAASVQSAQSAATTQSYMLSQCAGNFSVPSTQATTPQAQDKCVTPVVSCLSEHNEGDEARTMSGSRHTMSEEASIPSSRSSVKGGPASVHNLSSRNMLDGVASEPSSRHAGMDGQSELSDSSSVGGHASVRDAPERDAGSEVGSNYPSRHAEAHEPSQLSHRSAASVQSAATTQSYMLSQCAGNFSVTSTQNTTPRAQNKCATPIVSRLSEHNEGDEARTPSGSRHTMAEEASIPSSRSSVTASTHKKGDESSLPSSRSSVKAAPASVRNLSSRSMLYGAPSELSSRRAGMDDESEAAETPSVAGYASVRDAPERDAGSEVGSNYPSRHAEAHEPSQLSHRSAASVQSAATTQSYMLSQCAGNFSVTSTQNTTPRAQNKCATPIVSRLSEHNEGDEARTPSGSRHTMVDEASVPSSRSSVTASTHKKGDESSLPSSRSSVKAAPASVRNLSSRSMLYGAPSELSSRRAGMDDESEAAETPSVAGYASVRDAPERDAGSEVGSNYPSRHAEAHEPSQLSHRSAASVQSAATTQSYMLSQCAGNFSVTSTQNTTPRAQNKCATPIVSRLSEHNEGDEVRSLSESRHTMVDEASLPSSRSSVKAAPASVRNLSSRSMLYGAPSELSSRRAGMDDESEAAETPSVAGYASVRDAPERDAGSEVGSNYPSRHAEAHEASQLSQHSAPSVQSATTQSYLLSQCAGNFSVTSTQATTPQAKDKCATPIVSRLSEHNEGAEVRSLSESRHTMVDEASIPSSRSSVKGAPASVRNLSSRSMLYGAPSELSSRRAGMDDESETAETPSVAGYASVRDAPERDAGSEVGSNYPSRHVEAEEASQATGRSSVSEQSALPHSETVTSGVLSQCAGNFSVTTTEKAAPVMQAVDERQMEGVESARSSVRGGFDSQVSVPTGGPAEACVCDSRRMGDEANSSTTSSRRGCLDAASEMPDVEVSAQSSQILSQCAGEMEAMTLSNTDVEETKRRPRGTTEFTAVPDEDVSEVRESDAGLPELPLDRFAYDAYYMELRALREAIPNDDACGTSPLMVMKRHAACLDAQLQQRVRQLLEQEADALSECDSQCHFISSKYPCLASLVSPANLRVFQSPSVIAALAKYDAAHSTGGNEAAAGVELHATVEDVLQKRQLEEEGIVREYPFLCCGTEAQLVDLHLESVPEMEAMKKQHRDLAKDGDCPELRRLEKAMHDSARCLAEDDARRVRHQLLEAHYLREQLKPLEEDPTVEVSYVKAGVLYNPTCHALAKTVQHLRSQAATPAELEDAVAQLRAEADRIVELKREVSAKLVERFQSLPLVLLGVPLADLPLSSDAAFQALSRASTADPSSLLACATQVALLQRSVMDLRRDADDDVLARLPFLSRNYAGAGVPLRELRLMQDATLGCLGEERLRLLASTEHGTPIADTSDLDAKMMNRIEELAEACTAEEEVVVQRFGLHEAFPAGSGNKRAAALLLPQDVEVKRLTERQGEDLAVALHHRALEIFEEDACDERLAAQERNGLRRDYPMCAQDMTEAVLRDATFTSLCATRARLLMDPAAHDAKLSDIERSMTERGLEIEALRRRPLHREVMVRLVDLNHVALCTNYQHMQSEDYYVRRYRHLNQRMLNRPLLPYTEPNMVETLLLPTRTRQVASLEPTDPFLAELRVSAQSLLSSGSGPTDALVCGVYRQMDARVAQLQRDRMRVQEVVEAREAAIQGRFPTLPAIMCGLPLAELCHDSTLVEAAQQLDALRQDADAPQATIAEAQQHLVACATQVAANLAREEAQLRQQMPCVGTLAGRPALRGLHLTSVPEMDALLRQHRELAKSGESPELRRLEKVIQDLAQRIAENVAERMRHELLEAHFLKQKLATVNEDPMAGMNYAEAGVLHDAKCRELAKEVEQLRSQAAEDAVVEEAMKRLVERADRVLAFKRQRTAQLAQSYPPLSSTVLGVLLADLPLSTDAEFQAAVAQCAKCARSDDADERARLPEGQGKLLSRVDELARQVNLVRLFHAVEDDAVRARHPFLPSNNVCWVPCRDLSLEEDPSTLNFMHQRRRAIQVGDATREAEVDAQLMTRATAIATDLIIASDATHRRALYASEWKHAPILFPSLVVDRDDVFASLQETGTNDAQRLDEVAEAQDAVMEKTRARVAELLSAYTAVEQSIAQETCGLRNRYAMCVRDVNPAVEDDQYFAVLKQTHDDWQNVVDAHHAAIHEVEEEMWRQSVSLIPDDRRVATAFGAECQAEAQLRLASDPNAALLRQRDSAFYSHQLWRLRQLRRRPNYAADASELSTSACDEQLDVSSLAAQDSYYLLLQHHRDMCAASDEKGAPVRCIDVLLRRRMRQLGDAARRQKRAITQQDDHLRRQFPCLRLNSSATPLASLSYGEDAELQRLVAEHTRLLRPPNDIKERYPFLPDSIDDVPIEDLELEKDPLFLRLAAQRQDLLGPLRKKIDAVKQVEAEIQTRFSVLLAEDVREESELRATYPFADPQVAVPLRCLHLSRRKDFVARLETYKAMASSDDEEVRRQRDELEAELRDAVNQLAAAEALWQRSRWLTAESLVHAFPCLPVQPAFGIHLGEIGLLEDATFRRLCVQLFEARKSTADDRDADIASREVQLIQHVQAVALEKQASSVTGQKRFPGLPQRVDGLFLCDLVSALEQRGTVDDEAAVWNEAARQKLTQTYRAEEDEAVWCRHPFFRDMQLSGMPLRDMTELSERDKFHTYFKRWLTAISRRSKEKKERAPMFEDLLRETAMVVVTDRILSDASFHDDLRQAGVTCMALDPAVPLHQLRSYSSETTKPLVIHNDTVGATEEEQNLLSRICSSYGAALTGFSTRLEDVRRQYPGVHHREINVVSATDNEMLVLHAQRVAAGAARTVATHEAREEAEEGLKDRSVALMEEDHYVVEAAELCDALRDVPMVKLPTEADMMHRWGFVVARAHHHRRQMYDFAALPAEAEEDRTGSSKSTRSRRRTPAPVEMTEVPDNEVVEINDDLISTTSSEETHRRRVAKAEKPAPVPAAPREVLPDRDAVAEAEAMPVAAAEEVVPAPVAAAAPIKATEAAEARFVVPSAGPRPEQPKAQRSASKKKRPTRCPRPHVNISKLEEDPVGELRTGRWEEFLPLTRGAAQKLRQMLGGKDDKGGLGSGKRRQSMPAERIPRGSRWFSAVIPQDEPEVVEIRTERQYIARTLHKANKHLPRRVTEEEVESSPNAMDLVFEYYDLSSRAGAAGSIRHAAPIVRARLAELNQLFEEWIASAAKSSDTPDLADKGEEDRLIAEAKAVRLARRDGLRASASHSCVCNPRNVPMRWAHLSTEELEHDDDLRHLVDSGASKEEIRGHLVNWSLLKETANDALFTKYSFLPVLPYGYSLAELNLMEDGTFQGYARNGAYKSSPHLQASMREAVESLAKNKAAAAPRGTGFVERVRAAMMDGQPDEPLSSRDGSSARSSPREDDPMVAALRAAREKKLSAFLNDATRSSFLLESQTKSRSVLQHLMQHIADISPDLPSVECTREMPLSVDDITALRTFFDGLDPDNFGLVDRADFEHFAVLTLGEEVPHLTRQVVDRLTFSTDFDATNIAVKAPELVDFSDFTTFYKSLALVELRRQMETEEQRRRESTRLGALGLTGPTASGGQRASGLAGSRPAPAVAQVH